MGGHKLLRSEASISAGAHDQKDEDSGRYAQCLLQYIERGESASFGALAGLMWTAEPRKHGCLSSEIR